MKSLPIHSVFALIVLASVQTGVCAAESTLDGRVGRLERILENQSGSDLLLQVQRLQMEVQELRGMLEAQRIDLDKLKRQQRDQYLDIDSRLGAIHSSDPVMAADPAAKKLPEGVIDASGGDLQAPDAATPAAAETAPPATGPVGIPPLPQPETTGGSEREAYRNAFALLKDKQYDAARDAFHDLLNRYPQGEFTDSARYWLGETYYVQRNYPAALEEFERLVKLNPSSP